MHACMLPGDIYPYGYLYCTTQQVSHIPDCAIDEINKYKKKNRNRIIIKKRSCQKLQILNYILMKFFFLFLKITVVSKWYETDIFVD